MPSDKKKFLQAQDFEKALKRLDHEMSKDDFLAAFAPINVVTVGGFLAVTYFKNREATGDLDYIIEPQWAQDDEIKAPLKGAIMSVAKKEKFELNWMNDDLEIWATSEACKTIFTRAYEQNIILFDGKSLRVWAAPFEWALERKLRRIAYSERGNKKVDMEDALVLFKHFREANKGPLDMESFRNLNMNGFDLAPEPDHMEKVAANYREVYNEVLFSSPTAPATSYATSSYSAAPSAAGSSSSTSGGYKIQYSKASASHDTVGQTKSTSDLAALKSSLCSFVNIISRSENTYRCSLSDGEEIKLRADGWVSSTIDYSGDAVSCWTYIGKSGTVYYTWNFDVASKGRKK